MEKIPLIVIEGPTAVGKTAFAVELARRIGGEVVSGDSMQVYREMNIGTAKPTMAERGGIRHYLIDEVEPEEEFNVVRFAQAAHRYIRYINSQGKIPILAGGTGLYIDSVVKNIQFVETEGQSQYREELSKQAQENGNQFLYDQLKQVDPVAAQKIHVNDLKRIIRALEVYHFTGKPISQAAEESTKEPSPYRAAHFALTMERERLYERINQRVVQMMDEGLLEEVESLIRRGLSRENTSMNGIGYKEFFDYFEGNSTLEDTVALIQKNSRNYAKRQYTWFNRNDKINWMTITPYTKITGLVDSCCRYLESFGMI